MRSPLPPVVTDQAACLEIARELARKGVPIGVARPDANGKLIPPAGWQHLTPDPDVVDRWRPGLGLFAVTGGLVDALDVDPQNGGDATYARLLADDLIPDAVCAVVCTPSGGWHYWLFATGSRCVSRDGIDLKAGDVDGRGRGLVWIPPTVKPSKTTGEPGRYAWLMVPRLATGPPRGYDPARLLAWFNERRSPGAGHPAGQARKPRSARPSPYGQAALDGEFAKLRAAGDGQRNNTLNTTALVLGSLAAGGELGNEACWAELQFELAELAAGCGLDPDEIRPTIDSGWRAGVSQPRNSDTYADPALWPPPQTPQLVARRWLAEQHTDENGLPTLLRWQDRWWRWERKHGCWRQVSDPQVLAGLRKLLDQVSYLRKPGKDEAPVPVPWNPKPNTSRDVVEMAKSAAHLDDELEQPSWLPEAQPPDHRAATEYIPFLNGLLRMSDRKLTPVTPALFVASARPFDWDPAAPTPVHWLAFLDSLWHKDPDSVRLLQELLGYLVSGRTDAQKLIMLIGLPRSGKGTIAKVATWLVGEQHTTSSTLDLAGKQFGMQSWIGKMLVIFPDVRSGRHDPTTALERLLSISGEDQQNVNRKGISDWVGTLSARLMLISNDLLKFHDASAAIVERALVLRLTKTFLGKEDLDLANKLRAELPGIMRWALDGLDRLVGAQDMKFTAPRSSVELTDQLREQVSPVSRFLTDEVVFDPNERTACDLFRLYYNAHRQSLGLPPLSETLVGTDLRSAARHPYEKATFRDSTVQGRQRNCYSGMRLRALPKGVGLTLGPVPADTPAGVMCADGGCQVPPLHGTQRCWAHRERHG